MFALDGQHSRSSSHASQAIEEAAQRGLEPDDAGPAQPSPATEATTGAAASQIDLSRRVVPVVDMSGDVCSICLDEFSEDDPAQMTNCGWGAPVPPPMRASPFQIPTKSEMF